MTIVKLLIVAVAAMILMLAAFGVGVSVGTTQTARTAAPAVLEAQPIAACPTPETSGELQAEPAPTVKPPVPVPSSVPGATTEGASDANAPLDMRLFNESWALLRAEFYGELPQGKDLTYAAIRGVVQQLGDPHTAFLDPKTAEFFNSDIEGHFEGIGARVEQAEGGGVGLRFLFAQQPAEKAGLRVGDVIIAVDGKDVTSLDLNSAIALIRGPRGTQVVLSIRREGEKPFDVTVTRDRIEIPVVTTKTLGDGKIAYVALAEFSSVAPSRLAEALDQALKTKPAGLILDLRGNPGGLLDAAVQIGSYFVPKGDILVERFKDGREQTHARQGRYLLGDTPLIVLVDGGSASASEIVAGAIQDAGTGKLLGDTTYGKGSVQLPHALSDGSQLRVTIAHWFTPMGREIHKVGLTPDIVVKIPDQAPSGDKDPQLDRAVEFLLTGK